MQKNPQLENGYLRIACGKPENDILLALARAGLTATELEICLVIIRKTWGYQKQWDWISYTTFEKLTTKTRRMVAKTLKRLIVNHIILVDKSNPRRPRYKFNKNFNEWDSEPEFTSEPEYTDIVNHSSPTKDNIKDNNNKSSKNGLFECTEDELKHIAKIKKLKLSDVKNKHEIIMSKIEDGIFQKKNYGETVYYTLMSWLQKDINEGKLTQQKTLKERLAERGEYEVGSPEWLKLKNKQKEAE